MSSDLTTSWEHVSEDIADTAEPLGYDTLSTANKSGEFERTIPSIIISPPATEPVESVRAHRVIRRSTNRLDPLTSSEGSELHSHPISRPLSLFSKSQSSETPNPRRQAPSYNQPFTGANTRDRREVIDLINSSDTEEENPPPAYLSILAKRTVLPRKSVMASPKLDNQNATSTPSVAVNNPAVQNPVPLDADGLAYPSPYGASPDGRSILDYEAARAKQGTPLVPTERRGHEDKYTSVLEYDLAVTSARLAKTNFEKAIIEAKIEEQAREIERLKEMLDRR